MPPAVSAHADERKSVSRDTGDRARHYERMEAAATPRLGAVVGSTFAGCLIGACGAGLLLVREWSYSGPDLSIPVILSLYVLDATLVVVCALVALYLRYRSVPDIRTGIAWVGLGLVAGGLFSLAPAIVFASSPAYGNYSDQTSVQGVVVVIVAVCCVLGIAAGALAWLSTRRTDT
jgi:hypothetical protein